MRKIVIASKDPKLEIGKTYQGLKHGPYAEPRPEQRYKVVVRSDAQGWIDCLAAIHGETEREWLEILTHINGPWYYYEIETD